MSDWLPVYRDTVRPLYRYVCRRVGGDRELAEDITQETFTRALSRWGTGALPDHPLRWLRAVAGNLIVDHARRHQPHPLDPQHLEGLVAGEQAVPPEATHLVFWGLSRLTTQQAALLESYHLDGLDYEAIGKAHGLSRRAVEGRLRRARTALRRVLAPLINGGTE